MKGSIDLELTLTTLAGKTPASAVTAQNVVDTTRCSSIRCVYTLQDWTPIKDAGPIVVGVAHPDYTNAEVEAWIENTGSWDIGNLVQKEVSARRIRLIGVFDIPTGPNDATRLKDGMPVVTKLNWILAEGDGLRFWAYNQGSAAIATTAPNVQIQGHANLWAQ